jgi:hypothetical protein
VETGGPVAKASAVTVPLGPFMGASATDPPAVSVVAPHLRFAVACTVDDRDLVSNKARADAAAEPATCEKAWQRWMKIVWLNVRNFKAT